MIAVALYHSRKILYVPLRKVSRIAVMLRRINIMPLPPFVFAPFPLIKRLIHHKQTEPVTKIQQIRRRRIVRGADSVAAGFHQRLQPSCPNCSGNSGAERAGVVVNTDAFQARMMSIQEKAVVRIKVDCANAERNGFHINHSVMF